MKREPIKGTFCGLGGLAGFGAVMSLCGHDFRFALTLLGWLGTGCLASWIAAQWKRPTTARRC